MRVFYIIHDNKKGGAAQSFLDLIQGVSKEHEVYVLTPHKKGYIPDKLSQMGVWHRSAHYYWWEIAKVGNPFIDSLRFVAYKILNLINNIEAYRIARMVEGINADIIHSNSSTINIGALVSDITGIPHIWHLRELALPEYPLYPARKKDSIKKQLGQGNSVYVAISEYTRKFYSNYIDEADRIHVVYNGISSLYNHKKSKDDYSSDVIKFLISGNYSEEKGQLDVAHALGRLISLGVTGFKVYMAGRGDFAEVKRYLNDNQLTDYVVFCGLIEDMLSLRKECDVEIVASKTEAFGRVTVEAMRASNAVIGSATGGTTELIQHGITGFLYEYKNHEALSEYMKRFIDDHELAYEMGQRAYKWSLDKFTSEESVEGILDLYKSVCEAKV